MREAGTYVEVLLPLPLPGTFCYLVPPDLIPQVGEGKRVEVQFGRSRVLSGLVREVHQHPPAGIHAKEILSVIDEYPVVNQRQLQFWDWMAGYYLCHHGEVMSVALPSAMKLSSESRIVRNPEYNGEVASLSDREYLLWEALQIREEISMKDAAAILELKKVMPVIRGLVEKGVAGVVEDLQERYVPKTDRFITLSDEYLQEEAMQKLFDKLERKSENQLRLLMSFIQLSRSKKKDKLRQAELLRESGTQHAVMKAMLKKGIFHLSIERVSRLGDYPETCSPDTIKLSPFQEVSLKHATSLFLEKDVVLLHGVTSSGKTEIYMKMIQEATAAGKQVLYLLPEIALTTQIINRLRKFFGDITGVYHSRYNEQEKVEIWNRVLRQEQMGTTDMRYSVILGARSALFLPFSRLGLIIVDEEHDASFKQQDPPPRYQARDAAIILARLHGAKVLLGSATPSIETFFNAGRSRYGLVQLAERYGGIQLPDIQVVDMKTETRDKRVHSHYSQVLLDQMDAALQRGEQVILFQNRRGFSLRLVCESCQWSPECKHCDVTLTYHKVRNEMRCHYCGYTTKVPVRCPSCGGATLRMSGFGTEKVEEELPLFFPAARIARMDLDSTRGKFAYQKIITGFETGEIDVLVGTQMVSKGLDFERVSLVCVLNADNLLSYPDFRSSERAFQLMLQVSGRSGRKFTRGKVIIQTWSPSHPLIDWVVRNDYHAMFNKQIEERKLFRYPPFYRLVQISLKHKDQAVLNVAAVRLASGLKQQLGKRVIGPEYPLVSRISQFYIKQLLVKIEREGPVGVMKDRILQCVRELEKDKSLGQLRIQIDVDPY